VAALRFHQPVACGGGDPRVRIPLAERARLRSRLGARVGKPVWTTKLCCNAGQPGFLGFGPRYDPTMSGAMWMADAIWQDLVVADEAALCWWSAASPSLGCDPATDPACPSSINTQGWNDGPLHYDPNYATDHNYRLYATKRFFDRGRWSVVLIDDGAASQPATTVSVHLPAEASSTGGAVTSPTTDLAGVGHLRPSRGPDGTFAITVHPQSVTTLTFVAHRRPHGH
jgi:hypothetical protein